MRRNDDGTAPLNPSAAAAQMARGGALRALSVTMRKHPSSLKVLPPLDALCRSCATEPVVLYDGPVRGLCPLAPNNVNTMACAAIAAETLGFDGVRARLVADPTLHAHDIDIEIVGPSSTDAGHADAFTVTVHRHNPAAAGAVTGSATYASFLYSLLDAHGRGPGVHLC